MNDRIGQQFGRYRLTKLLGRGGFAEVYLGQHLQLSSQQVAIKILSATHLDKAEDMQAFEREAETISSLVHPHIVRLLDFNITEDEKIPFLAMDYAPNGSLRQQHPLGTQVPLSTVVSYVQQVAEGLQYAHDQKHIHRDIKSDNMLIGRRSEILLSDFGIAVMAHRPISMKRQNVIGTPLYMAPEQFRGYSTSASDQYSLGIVVYEWLCGECPFRGTDFYSIGMKHINDPVPKLRQKVSTTLSQEVEMVVLKALSKDPMQRFPSVQDFAAAFEQASLLAKQTLPPVYSIPPTQNPLQTVLPPNIPVPSVPQPPLAIPPAQVTASISSPVNTTSKVPSAIHTSLGKLENYHALLSYIVICVASWVIFEITMIIIDINVYNLSHPFQDEILWSILSLLSIMLFFSWGWIMAQKTGDGAIGLILSWIGIGAITLFGGLIYTFIASLSSYNTPGSPSVSNTIEFLLVAGIPITIVLFLVSWAVGFGVTFLGGLIGERLSKH